MKIIYKGRLLNLPPVDINNLLRRGCGVLSEEIKASLANFLDLPPEVVLNLPQLIIFGNRRLSLQNHQGIMEYTGERVRVKVTNGEVEVAGRELVIRSILQQEVVLEGFIRQITFRNG